MSKQFRPRAVPSDIKTLIDELKIRVGVNIVGTDSPNPKPLMLESPIRNRPPLMGTERSVVTDCFLTPPSAADIRMAYSPAQHHWKIVDSSEIIEFSGCDYDEKIPVCGRFYYQNDLLVGDTICPKKKEFIEWADRIFRTTERLLHRLKPLSAHIGEDAERWRKDGGRFVSLLIPGGKTIYAVDEE